MQWNMTVVQGQGLLTGVWMEPWALHGSLAGVHVLVEHVPIAQCPISR